MEKSAQLSLRSVRASTALFLARFQSGECLKAIEEMARFSSIQRSSEYDELATELKRDVARKLEDSELPADKRTKFKQALKRLGEIQSSP